MREDADSAKVRFPPPLVYLGALVFGVFAGRAMNLPGFGIESNVRTIIGLVVILIGAIVSFSGARLFVRHGTAIIPHKPASRLVTTGIYRWTRNPMYLGIAVLYCGLAILFESFLALLLLPIVLMIFQAQVIAREEAYLDRTFGEEYRAYKARVRRWI